jgi:CRP-like cAMP-binding protein
MKQDPKLEVLSCRNQYDHEGAVRIEGSKRWTVIREEKSFDEVMHRPSFGLYLYLKHFNNTMADPDSVNSPLWLRFKVFKVSELLEWLIYIILFVFMMLPSLGLFDTGNWLELIPGANFSRMALVAFITFSVIPFWEALILSRHYNEGAKIIGFSWRGLRTDPVCWKIENPDNPGIKMVLFSSILMVSGWLWAGGSRESGLGLMLGSWAYLILSLNPMQYGPGATLLQRISGLSDIPRLLKWALAGRFIPMGQKVAVGRNKVMVLIFIALIAWIGFAMGSFFFIRTLIAEALPSDKNFWQVISGTIALGFLIWLGGGFLILAHNAYRLRGGGKLKPIEPQQNYLDLWSGSSALAAHIPELAKLKWDWHLASPNTYLTRYKQTDRTFFWLAEGEVRILGRNSDSDILDFGSVYQGSGVGEIALLENRPRMADVLAISHSVVASLRLEEFEKIANPEIKQRFREVVLAGQAFDHCEVFQKIPSDDKEKWIARGRPCHYQKGDVLVEQGSSETWMGLIAKGKVRVEKDGILIAELGSYQVIGEMAFLFSMTRVASVIAEEEVLLWKWEKEWLVSEVDRLDVRAILEELVEHREANVALSSFSNEEFWARIAEKIKKSKE